MKKVLAIVLIALLSLAASTPFHLPVGIESSLLHTVAPQISDAGMSGMACTAFIVDAFRARALTAEHCLPHPATSDAFKIIAHGGEEGTAQLEKLEDRAALLKISIKGHPPLKIAKNDPSIGEEVYSIGYGHNLQDFTVLFARVANTHVNVPDWDRNVTMLDKNFEPGMSGGPTLNSKDEVVGIVQAGGTAVGLIDSVDKLHKLLKD